MNVLNNNNQNQFYVSDVQLWFVAKHIKDKWALSTNYDTGNEGLANSITYKTSKLFNFMQA